MGAPICPGVAVAGGGGFATVSGKVCDSTISHLPLKRAISSNPAIQPDNSSFAYCICHLSLLWPAVPVSGLSVPLRNAPLARITRPYSRPSAAPRRCPRLVPRPRRSV
ncbi:hypothetical protein J6590_071380 [Homalodisca vitripennis]|nr:hypothetical protein J6590_071380 [Homalodisca vitripennis]